ncbi:MAG TPA: efflux RND transporter periplasmic adaptor subunit [Burkholderiales bacterium]|nr:efflux RND transporter periplasmic adaptor subunit [Burkholderiales bacterium]
MLGAWRVVTNLLIPWLLVVGIAGCGDSKSAAEKKATPAPAPVTVASVERRTVPLTVTAIGNVLPIESVAVRPRIDGQIVAVHVTDGQEVRKGQRLFDLDARYLQAQLKQLEAQEARDRALLTHARSLEARYVELQSRGFVSEEALTQARTSREAAEATVAGDRAAVETARVQLSYTRIDAPINGRVGRIHLPVGNIVRAADSEPLLVINKLSPIYVSFAVPERYLSQVKAAQGAKPLPVTVRHENDPNDPVTGRLSFIDNAVDQQTGTIRLNATFANEDRRLWPGQFVTATMVLAEQPNALVVPSQAIQNGPNGPYVYVVKQDHSADLRSVSIERTEGTQAVIAKGLQPGELVVTSGQLRLTPGAKVSLRQG